MYVIAVLVFLAWVVISLITSVAMRRVVPANEVHIVQSSGKTTSYGKDTKNGNVYYEWPSWMPVVGITKTVLPVSVFNISVNDYEAYDKDRVPFVVDVVAFFRISDSNVAAQRVQHFSEMQSQLLTVVKGAIRTVLASADINQIMTQRTVFGNQFTDEVKANLENWGVEPVKNLELMDMRDAEESAVIHNIMRKKQSEIEMESRKTVAENIKNANIAEITAQQLTEVQHQESLQQIGMKTATKDQAIGIAQQQAQQSILEANRETATKQMAVNEVNTVRQAEINKQAVEVQAAQQANVAVIEADGALKAKKLQAEGVQALGSAEGAAEQAKLMAPVATQIALAKEIGENKGYQEYLITIRRVEADQTVGVAQADALKAAKMTVIANGGDVNTGINKISDILGSKGGTAIAGMLQALSNTEAGKQLVDKVTGAKK